MELVVHQFNLISKKKRHNKDKEFVNPFGGKAGINLGGSQVVKEEKKESLHHLNLNFPKFTKNRRVSEWLEDCEQYFAIFDIADHKKSVIAGMHLEGVAKSWYQVFTAEKKQIG